jgi:hypothetical protein
MYLLIYKLILGLPKMLKNKIFLFFVLLLLFSIQCSTTEKISRPSESEFYSYWNHSIIPPIEGNSEDTKAQSQSKKKK